MLKLQVALIAILIACVAFISCERVSKTLEPVADDMVPGDDVVAADMPMDMMKMLDSTMYMSWMSRKLSAPVPMADATSPAETGAAHNPAHVTTGITTARTVYINDIGVMANKEGTAYPAGTVIVKEIMDDTNMFVDKVAMMMKSDDPMYAGHNGWVYRKYARSSADAEYMQVRGSNLEDAGNGCHGCHAKAENDSVFVSLTMPEGDEMPEGEMPEGNGAGNGDGMNGAGNGANGDGAGDGANGAGNDDGANGANGAQ